MIPRKKPQGSARINEVVSSPGGVTGPRCQPAAFFGYSKTILFEQNEAFFIWDKFSHRCVYI